MKKLLLVLAIGVSIAACNNATDSKAAGTDTAAAPTVDTTTKAVVVDTLKHDSIPAKVDSVKK